MLNRIIIEPIVRRALVEDIGNGDLTTTAIIPENLSAKAIIHAKEDGVLAGMPLVKEVYRIIDENVRVEVLKSEGSVVEKGTTLAEITGRAKSILTGERVALNFLQRMSGIATKTRSMAELIKYFDCHLTDTRKTTPGLRILEKYSVHIGGGRNHRFDLSSSILIKDNHIEVSNGIQNAVAAAKRAVGHTTKIEVEVKSLNEVKEALTTGADIIMLDNMDVETMREAVLLIGDKAIIEASGNITEENIKEVANTGVDFISSGSLTHSFSSLDISIDIAYDKKK
ncbi:MAG: carboxylating nicotinate-nucleotide diphosphorylase [Clostridia bacterium]